MPFKKYGNLSHPNYSLLLGLMIAGFFVHGALLKIYEMKASQIPVKPILKTYFDVAQLKHDREGNPYVAVGILTDAINEHAYYMAFYHRDQKLHFVSVGDERPYNLSLNQYIEQIEKELAPFRNKYIQQMETTLNSGQAGKKGRTEEILAELDSLIGLGAVKQEVKRILALAEAQAVRRRMGLPPLEQSWHMAFVGNPGTGKTTVARLIGELFGAVGLLPSGHLVTVGKADLVGQYIGHTAPRTREVVQKALGGILFVDEAYELADPGLRGEGFGGEALTEILVAMENYRDRLVVIVAGYSDVVEKLSKVNEGFRSRIGQVIEFPDYSAPELLEMAILAAKKQGFDLILEAREALLAHFRQIEAQAGKLGNGRYARNVIERCISAAVAKDPAAVTITADDVEHAVGVIKEKRRTPQEIWQEINSLVGLKLVKEYLREIEATVLADKQRREKGLPRLRQSLHMAFLGNPGTGKTTVARLVGELFAALGVLPSGHLVEIDRAGLVAGYLGQTALKVREVVDKALGGVLFVDEAYSLARSSEDYFGAEALDTLIKAMEDHRDNLVVILAGYTEEMQKLFKLNPGLESRVAFACEFTDYSPDELVQIARMEAKNRGFTLDSGAEKVLLDHFQEVSPRIGQLGNGRYARKLVEAAIRRAVRAGRVDSITTDDIFHEAYP
ncbi:MAG: AAA family ATPase [Hydrogenibacillus schlegelii]|uniref:AAA family ATPase n=1 Tax=Hydrogenibacillus schlegelii TaxID=1484 RepID=A0A947CXG8_HYDSH|nr:AAA family ATPase [Hydrogenibacillus schlegelii]